MKLQLIAFVLILRTETLAYQSPGTSIFFFGSYYLGKINIFMFYQTLIKKDTLFTNRSKYTTISSSHRS